MKKILFSAYSLDYGGIETALITLIKYLAKTKEYEIRELQDNYFYTPTEFAKLRKCSVPTALCIYNSKDFPSENYGKEKVALGSAIRDWYKVKRNKEEE